jgi:hypothetical protein
MIDNDSIHNYYANFFTHGGKKKTRKEAAVKKKALTEQQIAEKKLERMLQSDDEISSAEDVSSKTGNAMKIRPVKVKRKNVKKHNNFSLIPSHPYRSIFTGATGSGKTTMMVNLLTRRRFLKDYFDEMYLFSPNVEVEEEFKNIGKKNKHTKIFYKEHFHLGDVTSIFEEIKNRAKEYGDVDRDKLPRVLLFIDDFASDRKVMGSKILKTIFFMSRKYSVSTWISTQYYRRVPPEIRTNAEYHVVFVQPNTESEKIADEMSVGKFTKKKMLELMNRVADTPYSFLFINRKKTPNDGRFNFTFKHRLTIK